jgi:hypothetical protein
MFESRREQRQRATFDPDAVEEIENFGPEAPTETLEARIGAITFERMHLASAAPWWLNGFGEFGQHHLNAPSDRTQLLRWLGAALAYIRQELSRCVLRR